MIRQDETGDIKRTEYAHDMLLIQLERQRRKNSEEFVTEKEHSDFQ